MSKLTKIIRALALLIKKPSLINQLIESNEAYSLVCKENPSLYTEFSTIPLNFFTNTKIPNVSPFAMLDGGSLPVDLALLNAICIKYKIENYFEIGTWRGESAANVAHYAKNVFTLNLSNEELKSIGKDENYIKQQSWFSKNLSNVVHLKGNSATFNFNEYEGKMDLVFVDGDHRYDAVKKDTETAFRLIKPQSGIIVWHDYGISPELVRYEVIKGIVDGTPSALRNNLRSVSNTLCAVFTPEIIAGDSYKYPVDPQKKYTIKIETE